jgi:uncharacterized iron-regulated protein
MGQVSLPAIKSEPGAPVTASSAAAPCVFDGRTGKAVAPADAFRRATRSTIVYAGEKHDSAAHHERQRELLARMTAAHRGAAGAFEMLHGAQQPELDLYLQGTISEAQFLAAVDWKTTWGFPFALYRPLFDALRAGSKTGLALNVPKKIVHKVAQSGLGSLTAQERAEVPADFQAVTDAPYLAMLRETFAAHGGDPADAAALAQFVDAMSLWNEAMASRLAAFSKANSGVPVLVAAGAFHAYAAGMPASVARRLPGVSQTSFVLSDAPSCPASLAPADLALAADYVWLVTP